MLGVPEIDRALRLLGDELARRRIIAELVLLGGASLLARQLIERATTDIDVLGVRLPNGVVRSGYPLLPEIRDVANEIGLALGLDELWLDDRPGSDFANAAPAGFEQRLERATFGALVVWHLSAHDICVIKICATAERWGEVPNKHWEDVVALKPSTDDLAAARRFADRTWSPHSAAWSALEAIEELLHDA
ncbi:MAG: hypothetical protein KDC46_13110 [Thermoleophilia bacterium]|nr:hypothetical protein [Thermoleophilia bacterium]